MLNESNIVQHFKNKAIHARQQVGDFMPINSGSLNPSYNPRIKPGVPERSYLKSLKLQNSILPSQLSINQIAVKTSSIVWRASQASYNFRAV